MNKIINGEALEVLKTFPENSVNICITSPPYKDSDGFDILAQIEIFKQIWRVLCPNSLLFVNFGHLAEDKSRPFKLCLELEKIGFKLNDTIIWAKNHYKPIQGSKRLNNLTEFIFMFYKNQMPILDRLSIGVPYKDSSNAKRFNNGKNLKCGGNLWYINYPTINKSAEKLHKDMFPVELPLKCLKLSGLKTGTVLDPFAGSGNTGIAAKQLGLDYILIEKQAQYAKIMEERLK